MLDFVKRMFRAARSPADFADSELGLLRWSEEESDWLAPVPADPTVRFQIGGRLQPDPKLLAHARSINARYPEFRTMVLEALEAETAHFGGSYTAEIRALRLGAICLFWPKRPDDGMLYLEGGSEHRVWRFNYVARRPAGLGFDS